MRSNKLIETKYLGGKWQIFQDLAPVFNCPSNRQVEELVRDKVKGMGPALEQRVQFDSEGDTFCVLADSREDIESVAEIVESMLPR